MSYSPTKEELDLYEITALKHLEALKDIVVAKYNGEDIVVAKYNGEDIRLEQTFQYDVIRQDLTELEELKKRDIAMKLTQASRFTTDKKLYGMYACNNCHEVIPYFILNNKRIKPSFCPHCGQRLDWGDER